MRIAVLALQGAFIEHEQMLQRLGVETFQIRQLKDWQQPKDPTAERLAATQRRTDSAWWREYGADAPTLTTGAA